MELVATAKAQIASIYQMTIMHKLFVKKYLAVLGWALALHVRKMLAIRELVA
jgi:hypothetical protein